MRKKILIVAGARPNFVKIAPLMKVLSAHKTLFDVLLVHSGQHYDFLMSEVFFKDLSIPKPNIYLGVGSASHAVQTAMIMESFEKVVLKHRPNLIVVVGDVNSTLACSLVGAKLNIKIAHVESGLRSFDRTMPEEINRVITDTLSDFLFVSERSGIENLKREGISKEKIYYVGNIMIDTLLSNLKKIEASSILERLAITYKNYAVLTLHRPSNVDSKDSLQRILRTLTVLTSKINIIYPIHPRTEKMLEQHRMYSKFSKIKGLHIIDPIGYMDFLKLVKYSRFVITDSGGIQEESTLLRVPCLTMRENTERPVTIEIGSNYLVAHNHSLIIRIVNDILAGKLKKVITPKLWDGETAIRIRRIIEKVLDAL